MENKNERPTTVEFMKHRGSVFRFQRKDDRKAVRSRRSGLTLTYVEESSMITSWRDTAERAFIWNRDQKSYLNPKDIR